MTDKLAVFIDGWSLHFSARSLGFEVDFKRLLSFVEQEGSLLRAFYYTTAFGDGDVSNNRPLLDWLEYNGFTVRAKPTKNYDDGEGRRRFTRKIGVELAVDVLDIAPSIEKLMLFSGDGDFRDLIQAVQRRGIRTTVVSTLRGHSRMAAEELRRQADEFIELEALKATIGRTA